MTGKVIAIAVSAVEASFALVANRSISLGLLLAIRLQTGFGSA